nr:MAG TPA_asm: hypothetical protein [Caudoviricetes sp.]
MHINTKSLVATYVVIELFFLCPFSRLWKQLLLLSRNVSGKL